MKPSKHNNPESWRRDDVNLRRALQQRNSNLPLLPEGFADRLMSQLTPPEAQPRRRHLWPWFAAALSTAALVALVFLLNSPEQSQRLAEAERIEPAAVEENADESLMVSENAIETMETDHLSAKKTLTTNAKGETKKNAAEKTISGSDASAVSCFPADTSVSASADTATVNPASPSTPIAAPPVLSPADLDHLDHLIADAGKDDNNNKERIAREKMTETAKVEKLGKAEKMAETTERRSPKLALAANIGLVGGGSSTSDHISHYGDVDNFLQETAAAAKPANYYLPVGDGYTYAFTSDASEKTEIDAENKPDGIDGKDSSNHNGGSSVSNAYLESFYQMYAQLERQQTPVEEAHHQLPFTVGVSLRLPLSARWAIGSGLNYTRLASTFDYGSKEAYDHTVQRLHYLGIPVRCDYQLFQRPHWNIYVDLGGSVEIPLTGTASTDRIFYDGRRVSKGENRLSAPVQFSIGGGVGVQFSINRHIGLYAEPQVQWFIPTGSNIETYRTTHPFHFVPTFGVRWTM